MNVRWKKVAALLIFVVPVLLFVLMLAAEQTGKASDQQEEARQKAVLAKIRTVAEAAQRYASEHKGRFPGAKSWEKELTPYLPSGFTFTLSLPEGSRPRRIAMNRYMANAKRAEVPFQDAVLFYESMATRPNTADTMTYLPAPEDGGEGYVIAQIGGDCKMHPFGYRESLFRIPNGANQFFGTPVNKQVRAQDRP